jgi:hypothetical protein
VKFGRKTKLTPDRLAHARSYNVHNSTISMLAA